MKKYILSKSKALENKVICHVVVEEDIIIYEGESMPHYITWDEELGKIREAKLSEIVERGDYLIPKGFKLVGEEIVEISLEEKKVNGIIPLEDNETIENGTIKILSDYEMIIAEKKELLPGQYLNHETKELLSKEYPSDGKVYKWENGEWTVDLDKTKLLKQELQDKIIELETKKQVYINKGWDSEGISSEIVELEKQLNRLIGE